MKGVLGYTDEKVVATDFRGEIVHVGVRRRGRHRARRHVRQGRVLVRQRVGLFEQGARDGARHLEVTFSVTSCRLRAARGPAPFPSSRNRQHDPRPPHERSGPRRQARPDPRRPQRPGQGRRRHQRCAHPRVAADDRGGAEGGRARHADVAPRSPGGGRADRGILAGAGRGAAVRTARAQGALRARLARRRRVRAGRGGAARERALQQGREEEQGRAGAEDGGALRRLRDGCIRDGAPRRGEHARRRQVRAGRLRRPAAHQRARRAREGARQSEAAAGRDRRRLEGVDQAHGARDPARQGRQADRRRRHRQHVPGGGGPCRSASRCTRPTWWAPRASCSSARNSPASRFRCRPTSSWRRSSRRRPRPT